MSNEIKHLGKEGLETLIGLTKGEFDKRSTKYSYENNRLTVGGMEGGSGSGTDPIPTTHTYSTEEQVIGTWVDGKPIYERTYTNLTLGMGGRTEVSTGTIPNLLEIESIINGRAIRTPHDGYTPSMLALSFWRSSDSVLVLYNQSDFGSVNNIVLQYTKKAD